MSASIQKATVPIATFAGPGGVPVQVYVTNEWRRPLELLAALVNTQQTTIESLQARLTAAGL